MSIAIKDVVLNVLNMRARMPFRYGIASLVAVPHLFVRVTAEIDGRLAVGLAADGLPPKWFTKNPEASFEDDLEEMLAVIRQACRLALAAGPAESVYGFWREIYNGQKEWAAGTPYPPLLWGFGVSLVERALIDAFCRNIGARFESALRKNAFGIRLGEINRELGGTEPRALLPERASRSIVARHTVGLTDPLTDADVPTDERVDDGLPQSLEASIKTYGLSHLKIKLCGDSDQDAERLKDIATLMERHSGTDYAFTLDGNEQYTEIDPFRALWESIASDPSLDAFMGRLLFVEQPLKRDVALGVAVGRAMRDWPGRPPMIIDESDGTLTSAAEALELGYAGTSHKNCKGIFKGIASACLIADRRKKDPGRRYVLSSEDLGNVGPVALLQDLAVAACLGVGHTERNGHHYFTGLRMYPRDVQEQVLRNHGGLYRRHDAGFPTLDVRGGRLDIGSVVAAPFGYGFELDTTRFTPLEDWSAESLDL
ncbi:MAG: hypothetical protein OYM47_10620 [Gemmatimonadota bacterium]|nr:hypothetical protein [Gemmatimonadota bacterium]